MSYLFDAATEDLAGVFNSSHDGDLSIAMWVKKADWDGNGGELCMLSVDPDDNGPSKGMNVSSTVDAVQCYERDVSFTGDWATEAWTTDERNGVWTLIIATYASAGNSRTIYEEISTQLDNRTVSITPGSGYDTFIIGNGGNGSQGHPVTNSCYIAEVCLWDKVLSTAEVDQLRLNAAVGLAPNLVAPSDVFAYYPLDTDGDLTNYGSDTGGDLTATGATWSSDHPTIHQFGLVGSATNAQTGATAFSILHGLSIQEGDFIVAVLNFGNDGEISSNNGFNCRHVEENPSTLDTSRLAFYEKIATASEAATYTFPTTATAGRISGQILQFRGIDPDNPWDVPPSTMTRGTEDSVTSLTTDVPLTTNHAETIGLGIATCDADGTTFSGYTVGSNEIEHGTGQSLASVSEIYTTAGAKTAFDATASIAESITYWHIAVKADEADATSFGAVMGITEPWKQVPPAGTQIDWSNPITADMQILADFADGWPVNRVTNQVGAVGAGTPTVEGDILGMVGLVDNAGVPNNIWTLPKMDYGIVGKDAITLFVICKNQVATPAQAEHCFGYGGTGDDPFRIGSNQNDDARTSFFIDGVQTTDFYGDGILTGAGAANVWHVLAGKWSSAAGTIYTYVNKTKSNGTAASGSVITGDVDSLNVPIIGSDHPSTGSPYAGRVALAVAWSRELSDDEIYSLVDNPFQLYQPQRTFIPIETTVTGPVITDVANSGETPGSGTETWQDGSTGNVITGTNFM